MLVQGGMRAVIWTDVLQFFIMLGGMLVVLIKVRALGPHLFIYIWETYISVLYWPNILDTHCFSQRSNFVEGSSLLCIKGNDLLLLYLVLFQADKVTPKCSKTTLGLNLQIKYSQFEVYRKYVKNYKIVN